MRAISFAFLSFLLTATLAAAPKPKIENLSAISSNAKVSVRFSMTGAFANGEMVEALQSGVPTSFTYIVEIFRDRPNWFDDGIARALWLTPDELQAESTRHRSPLVWQAVADYLGGRRQPLDLIRQLT